MAEGVIAVNIRIRTGCAANGMWALVLDETGQGEGAGWDRGVGPWRCNGGAAVVLGEGNAWRGDMDDKGSREVEHERMKGSTTG